MFSFEPAVAVYIACSLCIIWRLVYRLRRPKAEMNRRRVLFERLQNFIGEAIHGLAAMHTDLENNRIKAQAVDWVRRRPAKLLKGAHGIGPETTGIIRRAGMETFGDVIDRGVIDLRGIGRVRANSINRYFQQAIAEAHEGFLMENPMYERNPVIDRRYDYAKQQLESRGRHLSADQGRLRELKIEFARVKAMSQDTTLAEQIQSFVMSPIHLLKKPSALFSVFATVCLLSLIVFALPHVILSWDMGWARVAGLVGAWCVFAALFYLLFCYCFLSDMLVYPAARPPNARNFAE